MCKAGGGVGTMHFGGETDSGTGGTPPGAGGCRVWKSRAPLHSVCVLSQHQHGEWVSCTQQVPFSLRSSK